jgi:hypothetical protein
MSSKPLLVGSVYAGSARDIAWLSIQREQLDSTVGATKYIHAVYIGATGMPEDYSGSLVVGRALKRSRNEHLNGLQCLVAYARDNASLYDGLLILDSDAFPVAHGWLSRLCGMLRKFGKRYAAAVRVENLDYFAHPCVAYAPDINDLDFAYTSTVNLLGNPVKDIACMGTAFLPLLKSNRVNVHPVLATVYSGMFYHHGCGSRQFEMRSTQCGYYGEQSRQRAGELFDSLHANAQDFIQSLI